MRFLALLILLLVAAAAFAASNRERPMIVDQHASGQWEFNQTSDGIRDDAFVWLQICNPLLPTHPVGPLKKNKGVHQT